MSKKDTFKIVVISVALSVLANLFFGRFLAAKVSTLPLLNRLKLISPQAPIVINTREEIRISESGDPQQIINSSKSKISTVISKDGSQLAIVGSAVNITAEGLFVTSKTILASTKPESLFIKLGDGTTAPAVVAFQDPATNLAVLKAKFNNVSVASLAESKGMAVGQKVLFLSGTMVDHSPNFQNSFVTVAQHNNVLSRSDASMPSRTFLVQGVGTLTPGDALVGINGEIVGMWDGSGIISGDILKDFAGKFINGKGAVQRPLFGFGYKNLTPLESKMLGLPQGARVTDVAPQSPAAKAGLQPGDVITSLDGSRMGEGVQLEELLQKYKPGDSIRLSVVRGAANLNPTLVPAELK